MNVNLIVALNVKDYITVLLSECVCVCVYSDMDNSNPLRFEKCYFAVQIRCRGRFQVTRGTKWEGRSTGGHINIEHPHASQKVTR